MTVSPGYFEVFKIPVKRGRTFNDRDTAQRRRVVIINEAMAKRVLARRRSAERSARSSAAASCRSSPRERERQIVGVVGDVRDGGLNSDPGPTMYIPQAQVPDAANALNVRLDADRVGRADAGRAASR